MSCYWDALINKINEKDIFIILDLKYVNPANFAKSLKKKNKKVNTILINNFKLTDNQQNENFEHIKNYNINNINNGYDCSTCDPFLILISDIFSITIKNNYNNNLIIYKPIAHSRYEICLNNNNNHMY